MTRPDPDRKFVILLIMVAMVIIASQIAWPAPVPAGILGTTGGRQFMTDGYGPRRAPMGGGAAGSFHPGADYAAKAGTPVLALEDGLVTVCAVGDRIYGRYMVVKDRDGLEIMYAHLSTAYYPRGTLVHRGQKIGLSGNSGQSTGPHLHVQVMMSPENYLRLVALRHAAKEPVDWRLRK